MMKKLTVLLAVMAAGTLAGCNTIEGVGKDLEQGGEKVQDSAKDTREKM